MKVALVLNGDAPDPHDLKMLEGCKHIVCADGAARFLLPTETPPTVIVGDLDSLDAETYKWAEALDVPIERYPEDKDETDGELALEKVLELDPSSALILGGHGGRSAMFLANLRLLRRLHDNGIEAKMVGRNELIRFLGPGSELPMAGLTGAVVDVLPHNGNVTVDLDGFAWSGKGIELQSRSARGVSNRVLEDGACITVHEGTALVIVERAHKAH